MSATSSLTIKAELSQLRSDIQAAGALTEGETKRLVIALEKRIKASEKAAKDAAKATRDAAKSAAREAEKAAEKAAKEAERAAERSSAAWTDTSKKLATLAGGPVATLGEAIFELVPKAGQASGALGGVVAAGVGIGASVAVIGAAAAGVYKLGVAAEEAATRLQEAGLAAEIPPEARVGIEQYRRATEELQRSLDLLVVTLGSDVSKAFAGAASAASLGVRAFGTVADSLREVDEAVDHNRWDDFSAALLLPLAPGASLSHLLRRLADETQDLDAISTEAAKSMEEVQAQIALATADAIGKASREEQKRIEKQVADAKRASEKRIAYEKDFRAAVKDTAEEMKRTTALAAGSDLEAAQAAEAQRDAVLKWLDAEQRAADAVIADLQGLTAANRELEESWAMSGEAGALAVQVWSEQLNALVDHPAMQAIGDIFGQWAEQFTEANDQIIANMEDRHDRQLEQFETERDARQQQLDEWLEGEQERIDAAVESGRMSEREANAERKRLAKLAQQKKRQAEQETKEERDELEKRHQHQLKLAREAFKANQNLQRVQAIMEAGRAAISMIPGFAFLGPGAPVAAATAAATALGIQLGTIGAQEAPEFPMGRAPQGGSPDHPNVGRIRDDEAVMPGRWVAAQGGPRAVERMIDRNEGPNRSGDIHLYVDGRLTATARMDSQGSGSFDAPSWAAGRRPLYGV